MGLLHYKDSENPSARKNSEYYRLRREYVSTSIINILQFITLGISIWYCQVQGTTGFLSLYLWSTNTNS